MALLNDGKERIEMNKYKMYFLHDPIGNNESQIINFDKETIQQALDQGQIVIGVTQNDVREVVNSIDDIKEPKLAKIESFSVVLPSYVDSKIDNLTNVVEKLVDGLGPSLIKPSLLNNLKKSITQIHEDTLKTIEADKKMLESSPAIVKKEEI